MLTEKQNKLIRQAIQEKVVNLEMQIRYENSKPLKNWDAKLSKQLTEDWEEYRLIHEELVRVGC
ncbi:hypothetical protein I6N96_01210 [Enterococcus sp. BWM-S5]|uniref:Uncharacterized protein n=1 Tax=Enterococcus larvae TaxID=2794352 RepID=A0ABS4CE59_9ENTE|nr:hypothetical protein [Enterococcus larvae]MBP1044880.1 hypothetical protein [Enterococcus larvae]